MVESIKSLTKNIDVSKNSSSNIDKVDKLNATSVSQKPAIDTVDISGSLPAATLADFTKKPPIDMESVSRIKEAIAKGEEGASSYFFECHLTCRSSNRSK